MNILIVSSFFPPHKGGIETAAYNTALKLVEFGHNIVVLTGTWGNANYKCKKIKNFLVYRLKTFFPPEIKFLPQSSSFGIMPSAIIRINQIIKKHKIQLIHIIGRFYPLSILATIQNLLFFKIPMVISIQARLDPGIMRALEHIFDRIITRFLYNHMSKIICVSKSLKKRLENYNINKNKLVMIPNGVDTLLFSNHHSSCQLDKYISKKADCKKILFAGRLSLQKGVKYLLKAIPIVVKHYENVHLFILGNGNLEYKLKKLTEDLKINSYVTFLDMIPLNEMPNYYSSTDIFCLPSIHEGFPLTIAEALSTGLIIVASATEGIPEAISEYKNGFLAEPGDFQILAQKLVLALNLDEEKIDNISKNNISLANLEYSWDSIIERVERIYKIVCS